MGGRDGRFAWSKYDDLWYQHDHLERTRFWLVTLWVLATIAAIGSWAVMEVRGLPWDSDAGYMCIGVATVAVISFIRALITQRAFELMRRKLGLDVSEKSVPSSPDDWEVAAAVLAGIGIGLLVGTQKWNMMPEIGFPIGVLSLIVSGFFHKRAHRMNEEALSRSSGFLRRGV